MTPQPDRERMRALLRDFDFRRLFIEELGWDNLTAEHRLPEGGYDYPLSGVAHKRGVQVFVCSPDPDGNLPPRDVQRRLHDKLSKLAYEHLLIFVDQQRCNQHWLWVLREPHQTRLRTCTFNVSQLGEPLIQSLLKIRFSLSAEEALTLHGVTQKLRDAFDRDKVTKRFYDLFAKERAKFESFIMGIPDEGLTRWYVSVILNRLMFIYFIQKKGFLGHGDQDYLRHGLAATQQRLGQNHYYREFLCPLFFEGFARPDKERSRQANEVLGQVPYLDGGLFMQHEVERLHGQDISIADEAFEKILGFFEMYKWHLDETSITADDEINPDVLGYIFEKYINQKQMGAYYTKEDITGYISQNTVLPFILDRLKAKVAVAFQPGGQVWKLLKANPDRYIYEAVRRGVVDCPAGITDADQQRSWRAVPDSKGRVIAEDMLPQFVREGMAEPRKRMYDKRYNLGVAWPEHDGGPFALPTETWREYVERRKRCLELRGKLGGGEVHEVNDLITYNLNIRQFAADVLQQAAGDELIQAAWEVLHGTLPGMVGSASAQGITVLDPTVGSGAFLFAALNVLYPLYEICLDRMAEMVAERSAIGKALTGALSEFAAVLKDVDQHPNREYFILKSIIVDNLYGVDIMEEACEICKLRLFLKLVAQIDDAQHVEPLPDIDFNIRAGNTLVGFANESEVDKAMRGKLDFEGSLSRVRTAAESANKEFESYRWHQVRLGAGGKELRQAKESLRARLDRLRGELDRYLALQYHVDPDSAEAYEKWQHSHKPFHWWAEFYGIISRGGFDVIIGNPPYVEYRTVTSAYTVRQSYSTLPCSNLYTLVLERSYNVSHRDGWLSLIVPLSLLCTTRTIEARQLIRAHLCWVCTYDIRPSSLFHGVTQRLTILVSRPRTSAEATAHVGGYRRWTSEEREHLISTSSYTSVAWPPDSDSLAKFRVPIETVILTKITGPSLEESCDRLSEPIYVHRIVRYFAKALDSLPSFRGASGEKSRSKDYKDFNFYPAERLQIAALLNSTLFYWFWRVHCDGFHCGYKDVYSMPYRKPTDLAHRQLLQQLLGTLMDHFDATSRYKTITSKVGNITYQEFYPGESKSIIDEIDEVLGQHYGFSDEELDFIINYDIKYRLGRDALSGGLAEEEVADA